MFYLCVHMHRRLVWIHIQFKPCSYLFQLCSTVIPTPGWHADDILLSLRKIPTTLIYECVFSLDNTVSESCLCLHSVSSMLISGAIAFPKLDCLYKDGCIFSHPRPAAPQHLKLNESSVVQPCPNKDTHKFLNIHMVVGTCPCPVREKFYLQLVHRRSSGGCTITFFFFFGSFTACRI